MLCVQDHLLRYDHIIYLTSTGIPVWLPTIPYTAVDKSVSLRGDTKFETDKQCDMALLYNGIQFDKNKIN